jgi:hypothetical protein
MQVTDFRNGHTPCPKTLVISAERSGLNLVRHACEGMSSSRTPGKVNLSAPAPVKKPKAAAVASKPKSSAPTFKHIRKKKLNSGKGPTPKEIGESLVALFNAGKSEEAESTWYHRKIESIEADGTVFEGWKGVVEKGKWWKENFTVLSMQAQGPFVCSNGFTVIYGGRVRMADGAEIESHECGVYTVEDGRIVREQFMNRA